MAKNTKLYKGDNLRLEVDSDVESGDPVAVGEIVGVALTDADGDDMATIRVEGSAVLSVHADDGSGTTIDTGDVIYADVSGGVVDELNVDDSGIRFGYALEEITGSGDEKEIEVLIGY